MEASEPSDFACPGIPRLGQASASDLDQFCGTMDRGMTVSSICELCPLAVYPKWRSTGGSLSPADTEAGGLDAGIT